MSVFLHDYILHNDPSLSQEPLYPRRSTFASRVVRTGAARLSQLFRSSVDIDPRLREHQAYQVLERLYNTDGERFSDAVVNEYLKVIYPALAHKFYYSKKGVCYQSKETRLSPLDIARRLERKLCQRPEISDIAIPYDKKGHHVVIYIDRRLRQVEYYDPFGRPSNVALREQLVAIQGLFFAGVQSRIIENSYPHQNCFYRCAIWGLYYITRRAAGCSAEELFGATVTNEQMDAFRRQVMAESIKQQALSSAPPAPSAPIDMEWRD